MHHGGGMSPAPQKGTGECTCVYCANRERRAVEMVRARVQREAKACAGPGAEAIAQCFVDLDPAATPLPLPLPLPQEVHIREVRASHSA
jgi:hypothetical protein